MQLQQEGRRWQSFRRHPTTDGPALRSRGICMKVSKIRRVVGLGIGLHGHLPLYELKAVVHQL
jgi:hypothetical protein